MFWQPKTLGIGTLSVARYQVMITIDGSFGEGGGQILRSSLALSLCTGKPFHIEGIRAGRKRPGLMRQHLTAVEAAAEVGRADVRGTEIGSMELVFEPGEVVPGEYRFAVGTAGSATLVLQTVLPALLTGAQSSRLVLEGGTHNPSAPPYDFLARAFLPIVERLGPSIISQFHRPGFFPAGGGKFEVTIEPVAKLKRIDLPERGKTIRKHARAVVSALPRHIAERELRVIGSKMSLDRKSLEVEEVANPRGPGNIVLIEVESECVTEVFCSFGRKGTRAEDVAREAAREALDYLSAEAPVGEHLADQLLLPMALAGAGSFRATALTEHTKTNLEVLKTFLEVEITAEQLPRDDWLVRIR